MRVADWLGGVSKAAGVAGEARVLASGGGRRGVADDGFIGVSKVKGVAASRGLPVAREPGDACCAVDMVRQ